MSWFEPVELAPDFDRLLPRNYSGLVADAHTALAGALGPADDQTTIANGSVPDTDAAGANLTGRRASIDHTTGQLLGAIVNQGYVEPSGQADALDGARGALDSSKPTTGTGFGSPPPELPNPDAPGLPPLERHNV